MGWAFIFVFYPSLTLEGKSNRIMIDNPEKLAAWGTQEEEKHENYGLLSDIIRYSPLQLC
jgi:hypothetical protein